MQEHLIRTLQGLRALPQETEWVEFKQNDAEPEDIGEYLSALANTAALCGERAGYMVWGVEDGTHALVGTKFRPSRTRVGGQELESWLVNLLSPRLDVRFHEFEADGHQFTMLEVPAATHTPVRFKEYEYIRVGSYKKKLKEYPEKERALWDHFRHWTFERQAATNDLNAEEALALLEYHRYFEMTGQPIPLDRDAILARLVSEEFMQRTGTAYRITNLGAILYARDLNRFAGLKRKALRVIFYRGRNKLDTLRERPFEQGYAVGYESIVQFIFDHLPQNEELTRTLREEVRMYPPLAVRELLANALIHQDFSVTGAGPTVEVYADRMEVTNPGAPIPNVLRLIDQPPRSRNEQLAAFMRRINLCEERGSGIDRVVDAAEVFQLPPPDFRVSGDNMVAVLFAHRKLSEMDSKERIRACYQHACLCYVSGTTMTNTTLRKRFGIEDRNYPMASRIIAEAVKAELIKPYDPEARSNRNAAYVPFWA